MPSFVVSCNVDACFPADIVVVVILEVLKEGNGTPEPKQIEADSVFKLRVIIKYLITC